MLLWSLSLVEESDQIMTLMNSHCKQESLKEWNLMLWEYLTKEMQICSASESSLMEMVMKLRPEDWTGEM